MSVPKMTLSDASVIINEVSAADAKRQSLVEQVDGLKDKLAFNTAEIKKRVNLENANVVLESEIRGLRKEITGVKAEMDKRVATLTSGGWVIPMPKEETVKGIVSM